MERRGDPGAKSNIEEVDLIWPQIHAAPVQIDHWLVDRVAQLDAEQEAKLPAASFSFRPIVRNRRQVECLKRPR